MTQALLEKPFCTQSMFTRVASLADRAAHEARMLKAVTGEAVETGIYDTAHRIRRHPFMSVAAAFAIGLPVGALVGWAYTRAGRTPA